jgi:DNA polymerase-3 subunit gamma/tau
MGQALYRKYRPTSFDEAIGQEHITTTLKHAIKSGKISHAYLFTGPRGIGKTSVARILAHEVNGIPYKDDSIHLDIIEIDAASNRRIDEIRELRDKVYITPTSAKYKVYIIDEVHMLTREAFNALLKTLEEPPAHCIFILATTELHKLPETIISRTQRFSFNTVSTKLAAEHLGTIAKKEKITITDKALELLAQHGQGSFRDSISLLDQLSNTKGEITDQTVRNLLGLPQENAVNDLIGAIESGNSAKLLETLEELISQGVSVSAIARELGAKLRTMLIEGSSEPWVPKLMRDLLEVSASAHPSENFEIALLEATSSNSDTKSSGGPPNNNVTFSMTSSNKPPENKKVEKIVKKEKVVAEQTQETKPEIIQNADAAVFDIKYWPQVVEYAKKHAASLYTALKLAHPVMENNTLTLYFQFALHQKKLNQVQQKDIIGQIIEEITKSKVKVECEVNKEMFTKKRTETIEKVTEAIVQAEQQPSPIKSISNIFGTAEMIESN